MEWESNLQAPSVACMFRCSAFDELNTWSEALGGMMDGEGAKQSLDLDIHPTELIGTLSATVQGWTARANGQMVSAS